jgi:hypothetical protein
MDTIVKKKRMAKLLFGFGLVLMVLPMLVNVNLLMPMIPGIQDVESMTWNYWLTRYEWFIFGVGGLLVVAGLVLRPRGPVGWLGAIGYGFAALLVGATIWFSHFFANAETMFPEPKVKQFELASKHAANGEQLVLGVAINGEAKAYPWTYVAHHHKIQDTIGGQPVLITYCTMCRTARVYDPRIGSKALKFRLVGARHYNAVFEDDSTKSWWYQGSGTAATGDLKGQQLALVPYRQASLASWLIEHPRSLLFMPSPEAGKGYERFAGRDRRMIPAQHLAFDPKGQWQRGNWVVGIESETASKAYHWAALLREKVINDQLGNEPIALFMAADSFSYRAWNRKVGNDVLVFKSLGGDTLSDEQTGSIWNAQGLAYRGPLTGQQLKALAAHQEFWHSWLFFHPETGVYPANGAWKGE